MPTTISPVRSVISTESKEYTNHNNMGKLSIIIPVYNEETTIAEVVNHVLAVDLPGWEKEVVIADDGSLFNLGIVCS